MNRVTFDVKPSEIVAIVGESGSGKSTLGLSIINLLQKPASRVKSGQILFKGTDLLALKEIQMVRFRGNQIGMIFQDPMSSLDPVYTVGQQLTEAIEVRESRGCTLSPTVHTNGRTPAWSMGRGRVFPG